MLRKRCMVGDELMRFDDAIKLFENFFKGEPFWSNKPLFPPLSPSKELALMNYIEPLSDVYETQNEVIAKMEIPGVKKRTLK